MPERIATIAATQRAIEGLGLWGLRAADLADWPLRAPGLVEVRLIFSPWALLSLGLLELRARSRVDGFLRERGPAHIVWRIVVRHGELGPEDRPTRPDKVRRPPTIR